MADDEAKKAEKRLRENLATFLYLLRLREEGQQKEKKVTSKVCASPLLYDINGDINRSTKTAKRCALPFSVAVTKRKRSSLINTTHGSKPSENLARNSSDKSSSSNSSMDSLFQALNFINSQDALLATEKEEEKVSERPLLKRPRIGGAECGAERVDREEGRSKKQQKKDESVRVDMLAELPLKFREKIADMGGSKVELVIQKRLFKTDVNSSHNRLSMPLTQLLAKDFLTPEEKQHLNSRITTPTGTRPAEIHALLIDPALDVSSISLRKWDMPKKNSGNVSSNYVLVTSWNAVRSKNGLKEGMLVQVWSFRMDSKLCLAFVPLG